MIRRLFAKTAAAGLAVMMMWAFAAGSAFASSTVITSVFKDFSDLSSFTLNGSTAANNPGQTGVTVGGQKVLRLTAATTNQSGSAFLTKRVSLVGGRSFSAYFTFQISSSGGEYGIPGADGLVFVVQTKANNVGSTGGGIGYQGITPSVGVEFDTWRNDEAYAQDPNDNHIGIDVNGSAHSLKTANPVGSLKSGVWSAWVDYNGETKQLEVRAVQNSNVRPAAPLMTQSLDLGQVLNMDEVYVGFTSSTGLGWGNHDIRSFYFNNDYTPIDPTHDYTPAPAEVDVAANPTSLSAGGSGTVTAIVKDAKHQVMGGQEVTFTSSLGTITATATTDANGVATATLTSSTTGTAKVKAAAQGGAYGEVSVDFINNPPVAADLTVATQEDQAVNGSLTAQDADGNVPTFSLVTGPQKGIVSLNANGTFTYTPNADVNGSDSFTFKANDGLADSNVATAQIEIAPVDDPPSFVKGPDQTANKADAVQGVTVPGWATQLSAGPSNEAAQTLAFVVTNDHPELFASQPAIDPQGTLAFTPADNVSGTATVTVRLQDSEGAVSAPQTFAIRIDSIAPTISTALAPADWTNGSVNVTTSLDGTGSAITAAKWLAGAQTAADFQTGGTAIVGSGFTATANGTYTVYAQDAFGNETVQTVQVSNIDTVAPVTTATANPAIPNGANGWYTSNVGVTLQATDDLSGVASTEYRINGGAWTAYTGSKLTLTDGVYRIEYRSTDQAGNVEAAHTLSLQVDTVAPTATVTLDRTTLWPPNHKLVDIHATVSTQDGTSGLASVALTSITSSEPDNGLGDGDTAGDIQGAALGTSDFDFSLRAERSGSNPEGRVYTITYTVTDTAGNTSVATATVTVPHNPSK